MSSVARGGTYKVVSADNESQGKSFHSYGDIQRDYRCWLEDVRPTGCHTNRWFRLGFGPICRRVEISLALRWLGKPSYTFKSFIFLNTVDQAPSNTITASTYSGGLDKAKKPYVARLYWSHTLNVSPASYIYWFTLSDLFAHSSRLLRYLQHIWLTAKGLSLVSLSPFKQKHTASFAM